MPSTTKTIDVEYQVQLQFDDPFTQRLVAAQHAGELLRTEGRAGPMTIPQSESGAVLDIIDLADYVVTGRRPGETVEVDGARLADLLDPPQPVEIVEGHLDEAAIRRDQITKTTDWLLVQIMRQRDAGLGNAGPAFDAITQMHDELLAQSRTEQADLVRG